MKKSSVLSLFTLFLLLFGCGGGDGGSGSGALKVSLTDAPACGFDQVNVTVSKVRIHQSSNAEENANGWGEIVLSPPGKINLLTLSNGVLEGLGTTPLAAGHYTQLRLVLVPNTGAAPLSNSVVPTGGSETALETPSALQSGIKLIHEFDVAEGALVELVLDFDACRSVVQKGNGGYLLRPVISVIPQVVSGAIQGAVGMDPANGAGEALSNPRVTAQQSGQVIKSTVPNADGTFTLSPLVQSATAGNYDLVFTADNAATAVIRSVPATAQGTTTISTADAPVLLDLSTVRTVSGNVTPATAIVRALQTFPTEGPTVEIRSTNTATDTGSYSLSLPILGSKLGQFGTGELPILLTLRPDVAGQYTLEASSEGFSAESRPVTLGESNLTEDFTLTP